MTTPKVKRMVNRLDELAPSLPPPRDLWPAIEAAMAQTRDEANVAPLSQRRRTWWMPAVGMAAAVALVAVGVIIGRGIGPSVVTPVAGTVTSGDSAVIPAALRDADYRKQRDALLMEVNNRLQSMPPAEREKVAASLKTLQRSISDIEAALGRDPANALLQELLVNSCQEEMRALTAVRDSGSQET